VSSEHYPASSFKRIVVFDALATAVDSKSPRSNTVFIIISSKVDFIQKTMFVSLHRLIRASMGSFPAAFVAPSRNREYPDTFVHSAEVVTCTHKRSTPCCMTRQIFPVHTSLVWGPVDDPSQSLSSSPTPHTHPFVIHCTIVDFPGTTMVLEANFP
jgi:hypothetical protein